MSDISPEKRREVRLVRDIQAATEDTNLAHTIAGFIDRGNPPELRVRNFDHAAMHVYEQGAPLTDPLSSDVEYQIAHGRLLDLIRYFGEPEEVTEAYAIAGLAGYVTDLTTGL